MANPQPSPISQLLSSLGITKQDLNQRTDQMRQFLTAESAISSRVNASQTSSSASESRSLSRASSSTAPFTRQISRGSSISTRDASPTPSTPPIKPEPEEDSLPPRQFDSMEMVLERQRLNRKQKRSRKRDQDLPTWTTLPQLDSPAPSDASPSGAAQFLLPVARESDGSSHNAAQPPPVTPMRSRYYREHTAHMAPDGPVVKAESPSPARIPRAPAPTSTYPYPYYYYSAYASQSQFLSLPFRSAQANSANLKTPIRASQSQHETSPSPTKSPLPPSSPPDAYASSPASSPAHRLVNIVSSPGPMDDELVGDDPKAPPYKLPPGPYSDQRPHHSYAALIGQAILSSQDHRLTLQEIWMNSIRHVLSTTVHFRKVSRERSAGRSHWAIFDEDLECFVDGGYRKPGAPPRRGVPIPRPRPKKRSAEEVEEEETSPSASAKKSAKRPKKTATLTPPIPSSSQPAASSSGHPPFLLPALVHPQGKPNTHTRPATHHQTYYESCIPAPPAFVPSEIIFPPLPNTSYRLIPANVSSAASPEKRGQAGDDEGEDDLESEEEFGYAEPSSPVAPRSTPGMASSPALPASTSPPSIPALTPNNSSSSPIPSSDMDAESRQQESAAVPRQEKPESLIHLDASVAVTGVDDEDQADEPDGDERVFGGSLRPVQFWGGSSSSTGDGETLQPGIELQEYTGQDESDDDEEDVPLMLLSQTLKIEKQRTVTVKSRPLAKMPTSPTLHRRKTAVAARNGVKAGKRKKAKPARAPPAVPSTPPRNNNRRKIQLSPVHTPLSHKGLHMSPSASLAHYKSHLDPPPALVYGAAKRHSIRTQEGDEYNDDDDDEPSDLMRTPSRKRTAASSSAHPITPRRLLFPSDSSSPFRTPGGGVLSASPFRTPGGGRGGIFDPHDPSTLLDEELSSLGAAARDSPAGLFGKGALYDSPNPLEGSPGKWARWW